MEQALLVGETRVSTSVPDRSIGYVRMRLEQGRITIRDTSNGAHF